MSDILIGDRAHHPSLRLKAGQVEGFALPPDEWIDPLCGQPLTDPDFHPNHVEEEE